MLQLSSGFEEFAKHLVKKCTDATLKSQCVFKKFELSAGNYSPVCSATHSTL